MCSQCTLPTPPIPQARAVVYLCPGVAEEQEPEGSTQLTTRRSSSLDWFISTFQMTLGGGGPFSDSINNYHLGTTSYNVTRGRFGVNVRGPLDGNIGIFRQFWNFAWIQLLLIQFYLFIETCPISLYRMSRVTPETYRQFKYSVWTNSRQPTLITLRYAIQIFTFHEKHVTFQLNTDHSLWQRCYP